MLKRLAAAMAVLIAVFPAPLTAQTAGEDSATRQLRHDAVILLQGLDTLPFLNPTRISLVMRALETIRERIPAVRDVKVGSDRTWLTMEPHDRSIFLTNSGVRPPPTGPQDIYAAPVERAGVRSVDSLNAVFGVKELWVENIHGRSRLMIAFSWTVNVPVVAEYYADLPEIDWALPSIGFGTGFEDWIRLVDKYPLLHFIFAKRWRACPTACTDLGLYYVTYDAGQRKATLDLAFLDGAEWKERIALWDIPGGNSIKPYPTIEDLFTDLNDRRWWYRRHAVAVLALLLSTYSGPWPGQAELQHLANLKAAALAQRMRSYGALVDRLADPDPEITRITLRSLRELTNQDFPGGPDGARQWREWLQSHP